MLQPYDKNCKQEITSDIKGLNADRGFISHLTIAAADAAAASATAIHAAISLTDAAQAITTEIINPKYPRNISIKGNAVISGKVKITGTNIADEAITEELTINGTTEVFGAKAFKTVNKIEVPALTSAGDSISVGMGDLLGLPYKLSHNTVLVACLDNVRESTAPTVTCSATAIESNTVDLNSALSAKVVDIYLIV